MDIIVRNGRVLSGLGDPVPYKPWIASDIGIEKEKIVKIGDLSSGAAERIIDATNLMVSPGIINIHSHSDWSLIADGKAQSAVRQGITTEIIGTCGGSAAPLMGEIRDALKTRRATRYNIDPNWETMGEYLHRLELQGVSVNVVPQVGHSALRGSIMGFEYRAPSRNEMDEMKSVLAQSMDDGAWGLSTGLIYIPSSFAEEEEIIELAKVVSEYGGVYVTHMRGGGDRVFAATMEAIRTAEKADVSLHILHHKAMGDRNSAKVLFTLPMIDDAIARGANITIGMYPYEAGSANLAASFPPWAHEGGLQKFVSRLKDPKSRERLKREMIEPELVPDWESYVAQSGWEDCWDGFRVTSVKSDKNKWMEGKTLEEVRPEWQDDPLDFMFDLLIDEGGTVGFVLPDVFQRGDKYLRMVMRYPNMCIEGDSSALASSGLLSEGHPHPRNFGWVPRALGKYCRQERVLTYNEAIRKMTSLPAMRYGMKDRGVIAEGMKADIMIFDPKKVIDMATFLNPKQYPTGISYVIVNGELVINRGEHTGKLPGKVLRHKKKE
jgi:N-acyl-D-amino-acid deacylase